MQLSRDKSGFKQVGSQQAGPGNAVNKLSPSCVFPVTSTIAGTSNSSRIGSSHAPVVSEIGFAGGGFEMACGVVTRLKSDVAVVSEDFGADCNLLTTWQILFHSTMTLPIKTEMALAAEPSSLTQILENHGLLSGRSSNSHIIPRHPGHSVSLNPKEVSPNKLLCSTPSNSTSQTMTRLAFLKTAKGFLMWKL
jgi:hypothetical protein